MEDFRFDQSHAADREIESKAYNSNQVCSYPDPPRSGKNTFSKSMPSNNYSNTSSSWNFNDPGMKRRNRVAVYHAYAVEGKMKATLRKGFRWVKNKYSEFVHGY